MTVLDDYQISRLKATVEDHVGAGPRITYHRQNRYARSIFARNRELRAYASGYVYLINRDTGSVLNSYYISENNFENRS